MGTITSRPTLHRAVTESPLTDINAHRHKHRHNTRGRISRELRGTLRASEIAPRSHTYTYARRAAQRRSRGVWHASSAAERGRETRTRRPHRRPRPKQQTQNRGAALAIQAHDGEDLSVAPAAKTRPSAASHLTATMGAFFPPQTPPYRQASISGRRIARSISGRGKGVLGPLLRKALQRQLLLLLLSLLLFSLGDRRHLLREDELDVRRR